MPGNDGTEKPRPTEGFEWRQQATDGGSSDRGRVRPALVSVLMAAALFAVLIALTGPTSAHASFTADNLSLTSNAGQLTDLKMSPEGDVHYNGLESQPDRVEVEIQVRQSGGSWETVDSKTISATGREGQVNYSFAPVDVLDNSSLTAADFRATDGSTSSTDLDVRASVVIVGSGPGGTNVTTTAKDTMTITITNEGVSARTGGKANASAQAA